MRQSSRRRTLDARHTSTVHRWRQTLQGNFSRPFDGRQVKEFAGPSKFDGCFYPGAASSGYAQFGVTGGWWIIGRYATPLYYFLSNYWVDDYVGFLPGLVTFYRNNRRAPCIRDGPTRSNPGCTKKGNVLFREKSIMRITTLIPMSVAIVSIASGQVPLDTTVNDPRPMMAMADHLQQQFGIAINYEDPPFAYKDDIRDITGQVQNPRQRQANPNVRILVPRGGALSMPAVSVRHGQPADAAVALERAKSAHEAASFPGKFRISQTALAVFVEPQQVQRPSGEWSDVPSVLSVPISFPRERRTATDTLSLIVALAVKRGGTRIDIAAVPMVAFANSEVELGVSVQPARAALVSLFEQMSARIIPDGRQRTLFSYRLLFDPGLRYYLLSVAPVPNTEPNTSEKQLKTDQVGSFGRIIK